MRILLHAWGSRGDVQPTLALARGLAEAGHDVAIAAATDFIDWISSHGIDVEPFDVDLAALSRTEVGARWLGGTANGTIAEMRLMRQVMTRISEPVSRTLAATADGYDAVVTTPILLEAMLSLPVAKQGRLASALLQPTVSSAHGSSYVYAVRPGRSRLNSLVGGVVTVGARAVFAAIGRATRARVGAPRLSWRDYLRAAVQTPFLLGVSPVVTPPAVDWPMPIDVTGYWFLDEPDAVLPTGLEAFLAAGQPPVYLGFGSMSAAGGEDLLPLITTVVERTGIRAVILHDMGVNQADIFAVPQAPHELLFPRCSAVVSHGGAGTVANALRAGVPQVVVPHIADQPYYGRRMNELGVAPAPIPRRELTVDRLAAAIVQATDEAPVRRAAQLGQTIRQERGGAASCETP